MLTSSYHQAVFSYSRGIPVVTSSGSKVASGLERKTNVTFSREKEPPKEDAVNDYFLKDLASITRRTTLPPPVIW